MFCTRNQEEIDIMKPFDNQKEDEIEDSAVGRKNKGYHIFGGEKRCSCGHLDLDKSLTTIFKHKEV
jgi:hypothetical protein